MSSKAIRGWTDICRSQSTAMDGHVVEGDPRVDRYLSKPIRGVDGHLSKPIRGDELAAVLAGIAGRALAIDAIV